MSSNIDIQGDNGTEIFANGWSASSGFLLLFGILFDTSAFAVAIFCISRIVKYESGPIILRILRHEAQKDSIVFPWKESEAKREAGEAAIFSELSSELENHSQSYDNRCKFSNSGKQTHHKKAMLSGGSAQIDVFQGRKACSSGVSSICTYNDGDRQKIFENKRKRGSQISTESFPEAIKSWMAESEEERSKDRITPIGRNSLCSGTDRSRISRKPLPSPRSHRQHSSDVLKRWSPQVGSEEEIERKPEHYLRDDPLGIGQLNSHEKVKKFLNHMNDKKIGQQQQYDSLSNVESDSGQGPQIKSEMKKRILNMKDQSKFAKVALESKTENSKEPNLMSTGSPRTLSSISENKSESLAKHHLRRGVTPKNRGSESITPTCIKVDEYPITKRPWRKDTKKDDDDDIVSSCDSSSFTYRMSLRQASVSDLTNVSKETERLPQRPVISCKAERSDYALVYNPLHLFNDNSLKDRIIPSTVKRMDLPFQVRQVERKSEESTKSSESTASISSAQSITTHNNPLEFSKLSNSLWKEMTTELPRGLETEGHRK